MSIVPEEVVPGDAKDLSPSPTGELICLDSIRVSRNRVSFDVTARPQVADLAVKIDQLADCIERLRSSDPIAASLLLDRLELLASNVGRVADAFVKVSAGAPRPTWSARALPLMPRLPRPVGALSSTEPV